MYLLVLIFWGEHSIGELVIDKQKKMLLQEVIKL